MPESEAPGSIKPEAKVGPSESLPPEEATQVSITQHLEGLTTDEGRIEYLKQVLGHRGILSDTTRENILDVMGGLFRKGKMFEEGAKTFEQLGELDYAANAYQEAADFRSSIRQHDYSQALLLTKEGDYSGAAEIYEGKGWHQMAMELWNQAGDFQRAEAAGLRAAEENEQEGLSSRAAALYIRAGHPEKALTIASKLEKRASGNFRGFFDNEDAAHIYRLAGNEEGARENFIHAADVYEKPDRRMYLSAGEMSLEAVDYVRAATDFERGLFWLPAAAAWQKAGESERARSARERHQTMMRDDPHYVHFMEHYYAPHLESAGDVLTAKRLRIDIQKARSEKKAA